MIKEGKMTVNFTQDQKKWLEDYARIALLWRQLLDNLKSSENGDYQFMEVSVQLEKKVAEKEAMGFSEDNMDITNYNKMIRSMAAEAKKSGREITPEEIAKQWIQ
jgi:hypothetical protein